MSVYEKQELIEQNYRLLDKIVKLQTKLDIYEEAIRTCESLYRLNNKPIHADAIDDIYRQMELIKLRDDINE